MEGVAGQAWAILTEKLMSYAARHEALQGVTAKVFDVRTPKEVLAHLKDLQLQLKKTTTQKKKH